MENPEIPSNYWMAHLIVVIGLPIAMIFAVIGTQFRIFMWAYVILAFLVFGGALFSLYGYHVEAEQLKQVDSDWVPFKGLYILGHIVLFGWFVALIYLIQRYRHIGIPWNDLPLVGS